MNLLCVNPSGQNVTVHHLTPYIYIYKVTWFNPPFSSQVTTNITKVFNNLIDKYFKKGTLLGKLFNKNSLKLSYSTTANLGQIISGHNKRVLAKKETAGDEGPGCNCQKGVGSCPVDGGCLNKDVIYEAKVTAATTRERKYIGSTASPFLHPNYWKMFVVPNREALHYAV